MTEIENSIDVRLAKSTNQAKEEKLINEKKIREHSNNKFNTMTSDPRLPANASFFSAFFRNVVDR